MQIQRIPNSSLFILLVALVFEAASLPNPHGHKKIVVVEPSDEFNTITKGDAVGASWGGYSASAGLGGGPSGGGLHAEAGGPGLGAGAGISSYSNSQANAQAGASAGVGGAGVNYGGAGASAGAGAGAGGAGVHYGGAGASAGAGAGTGTGGTQGLQGGFFDNIFNIPVSVLQAVNKYLNQKGPVTVTTNHHAHHVPSQTHPQPSIPASVPVASESGASASAGAGAGASAGTGAYASANAGASSSAGGPPGSGGVGVTYVKRHGPTNYDDVFNIPISALKSVNHLLNG